MIADKLLATRPFEALFILTIGGNRYHVPSGERAAVDPQPGLHITAVQKEATQHA